MVLIFVKQNDADARPRALKVEAGQIINLAGLEALMVDKPSKEDLEKGMTKQQMLSIIHGLGMRITHESKATKGEITDLILKNWDNKIMSKVRAVSSQPASSDDTQTSSSPVGDETQVEKKTTDDEKIDDDYPNMFDFFLGMTPEQFDFFLRDESHFFTNPREIAIFLGKTHGKHLFNITVEKWVTTTEMAKVEVMRHINFLAKDTNHETITIDDFMLSDGHNMLKDNVPILTGVSTLYIVLRLRGGALGVKRLEKTKSKSKVADTTKALQASTSKIGHDLKVVLIVQKIEKTLDDFSKSITNVGVAKAMTNQMKALCQTSPQVAQEIVAYLSTSQSGSAEVKIHYIAEKFLQCDGITEKVAEMNAVSESVKLVVYGAFQQLVIENSSKKGYTIATFRDTLDMVLNMRDGDDAML